MKQQLLLNQTNRLTNVSCNACAHIYRMASVLYTVPVVVDKEECCFFHSQLPSQSFCPTLPYRAKYLCRWDSNQFLYLVFPTLQDQHLYIQDISYNQFLRWTITANLTHCICVTCFNNSLPLIIAVIILLKIIHQFKASSTLRSAATSGQTDT